MAGYVAIRKDVCAGLLLKTYDTKCKSYDKKNDKISNKSGVSCRGMLFNVTDEGLANDLIYTTPTKYPINGIPQSTNKESDFIIENYLELDELLKHLKYDNYLTQYDLNEIYKKLITNIKEIDVEHLGFILNKLLKLLFIFKYMYKIKKLNIKLS